MQSPIARMQQAYYPREPHPLAHLHALRQAAPGRIFFNGFGDLVTGAKAGVSAGSSAATIGGSIATYIGAGAAAGSVVPIIGTAIGVIVALVASGVFSHRADPEVGNFNNAMALVRAQGAQAVLGIQDKYLVLAGLFDLEPSQIKGNIPIYKKFGRMGEFAFVNAMCNLIQQAANQGIINANDTVQSVYDKVVAPWIAGWGYGPMSDSNAEMIQMLILGLIGEYVSGQYKQRWFAVGGQYAFPNLAPFVLPGGSAVAPTTSGTPVPTTTPAPTPIPAAAQPPQPVAVPAGFVATGSSYGGLPVYVYTSTGASYTWNGQTGSIVPVPTTAPTPPQTSAVPVPSGFTLIGSANGLAAYQGPDGYYYSWSGTVMSPLTGYLQTTTGQGVQVTAGSIQSAAQPAALPSLTTNTQAGTVPYVDPNTYAPYSAPTTPIPTIAPAPAGGTSQIVSAGVGTGLPSWLTWGAVASVVGIMVLTARPAPAGGSYSSVRRRRRS